MLFCITAVDRTVGYEANYLFCILKDLFFHSRILSKQAQFCLKNIFFNKKSKNYSASLDE